MFGVRYLKSNPTTYVLHYSRGILQHEGPGISFLYFAPSSNLVAIPLASQDAPFFFEEVTQDYQSVTIQGQVTYRVTDPHRLAELFDLSVDHELDFLGDDFQKLEERLVHTTQVLTRTQGQGQTLEQVLASSDVLSRSVLQSLTEAESVKAVGVEILDLVILAIKPTPDTARALEAEAREGLLRLSDEAVYARRNAAVEQERLIRESELNTQIAVEEKKRLVREKQMAENADKIGTLNISPELLHSLTTAQKAE
jgi:regulator of protease activity HflC (stomatin/prohibitin superfamily)